jgi:hypothetical protein
MLSRHRAITNDDKDEPSNPHSFQVNEPDDETLKGTWLSHFVEEDRKVIVSLKNEVAVSISAKFNSREYV